jgi:hypothetical protein
MLSASVAQAVDQSYPIATTANRSWLDAPEHVRQPTAFSTASTMSTDRASSALPGSDSGSGSAGESPASIGRKRARRPRSDSWVPKSLANFQIACEERDSVLPLPPVSPHRIFLEQQQEQQQQHADVTGYPFYDPAGSGSALGRPSLIDAPAPASSSSVPDPSATPQLVAGPGVVTMLTDMGPCVWEERDSFASTGSASPYHPDGWSGTLPGPAPLSNDGQAVSMRFRVRGVGKPRAASGRRAGGA